MSMNVTRHFCAHHSSIISELFVDEMISHDVASSTTRSARITRLRAFARAPRCHVLPALIDLMVVVTRIR